MRQNRCKVPGAEQGGARQKPTFPWGVQVIGDLSEVKALAAYRALQKKHEAILGSFQPRVIRTTTVKMNAAPTWTRIRIEAGSRQVAEALCSRLRAAGESCLVRRNEVRVKARQIRLHFDRAAAGGDRSQACGAHWPDYGGPSPQMPCFSCAARRLRLRHRSRR